MHQPIRDIPGLQRGFEEAGRRIDAGRIGGHGTITSVAHDHDDGQVHVVAGSPEGITGFQEARILHDDDGFGTPQIEAAGDGEGFALTGDADDGQGVVCPQLFEKRT